jgi:hypothetical protein
MVRGKKVATLVGSDKGGVGKSMVSLVMALVFDKAGIPLTVVEIDNQRKLSTVLGAGRVNLSLAAGPELRETVRNRHAAESFYNDVYAAWSKGASVTDLGANVTTSLLAWYRQCDIAELAAEDNVSFRFVACASPDDQALRSALAAVKDASETLGPNAECYVVLNDLFGLKGFQPYEVNESYVELKRLAASNKVRLIEVPFCESLLLEHGKAIGLNPLQVIQRFEEVSKAAGLDQISSRVHKKKMVKWLMDIQSALEPLLVVDAPEEAAAPARAAAVAEAQ